MTETEEKLRRLLHDCAPDAAEAEHLLDEVLAEKDADARKAWGLANARDVRLTLADERKLYDRIDELERSLAALREAVGLVLKDADRPDAKGREYEDENGERLVLVGSEWIEILRAAHDGAPAAQVPQESAPTSVGNEVMRYLKQQFASQLTDEDIAEIGCWAHGATQEALAQGVAKPPAAPTLTLEEDRETVRKALRMLLGSSPEGTTAANDAAGALDRILAQKGAGRG